MQLRSTQESVPSFSVHTASSSSTLLSQHQIIPPPCSQQESSSKRCQEKFLEADICLLITFAREIEQRPPSKLRETTPHVNPELQRFSFTGSSRVVLVAPIHGHQGFHQLLSAKSWCLKIKYNCRFRLK
uniref:Uncharacterized protein n=1 Tax=Micrurus paraensis TaxID=1970185 RepID=A0A2D4JTA8_9SAUR